QKLIKKQTFFHSLTILFLINYIMKQKLLSLIALAGSSQAHALVLMNIAPARAMRESNLCFINK
ncbi:MAG: hypothetical protein ACSW8D_12795, partial [Prevotella sp.]